MCCPHYPQGKRQESKLEEEYHADLKERYLRETKKICFVN